MKIAILTRNVTALSSVLTEFNKTNTEIYLDTKKNNIEIETISDLGFKAQYVPRAYEICDSILVIYDDGFHELVKVNESLEDKINNEIFYRNWQSQNLPSYFRTYDSSSI